MSNHSIFTCECCGSDYLINFQSRTFEPLFDGGLGEDFDSEQIEFDDEATHVLDLDGDLCEEEITAEPEPGQGDTGASRGDTNASLDARRREVYENGGVFTPGEDVTDKTGRIIRENVPVTRSGNPNLRVETAITQGDKPNPTVRQRKQKGAMKPMTEMKGMVRPPKKKIHQMTEADIARDGFQSYGDDATQDFVGLTGQDAHFDNLLQSAYESDLASRGIPNY